MFADPISATLNTVVTSLPRITVKDASAVYRSANGKYTIKISHQDTKTRTRRLIRFESINGTFTSTLTGTTSSPGVNVYMVIDEPLTSSFDDTSDLAKTLCTDFMTWLTASTNANLVKVLGAEI